MAATTGVLTNISEMIDLAIGTPDIGVVDFCMLQTVLHCLAQQLGVKEKNVELRGDVASFPVGRQTDECPTIAVDEYLLETDGQPAEYPENQNTILIVQRIKKGDEGTTRTAGTTIDGQQLQSAKTVSPRSLSRVPGRALGGESGGTQAATPAGASGAVSDGSPGGAKHGTPSGGAAVTTGPDGAPGGAQGGAPGGAQGGAPGGAQGGAPGGAQGGAPGTAQDGAPGIAQGGTPGVAQGGAPGVAQDGAPDGAQVGALGGAPGGGQGGALGGAAGGVQGGASGGAPSGAQAESGYAENKAAARSSSGSIAPRALSSSEKLSLVTVSKFNLLEKTVEDLKNRVYGSIPKNEDILQEVRSQTNLKAITYMWTSLNVSSRLEAAEEGIGKLSSLIQDIIAETSVVKSDPSEEPADPSRVAGVPAAQSHTSPSVTADEQAQPSVKTVVQTVTSPKSKTQRSRQRKQARPGSVTGDTSSVEELSDDECASKEDLSKLMSLLNNLRNDHERLTDAFYSALRELNIKADRPPPSLPPAAALAQTSGEAPVSTGGDPSTNQQIAILNNKLQELETKLHQCCDAVFAADGSLQDQITSLQDQVEHNARFVVDATDGTKVSPDLAKDLQGLVQLFETVQDMQVQLQQVHETAVQLASEKEDRQQNINSLLEQIELLKAIKLDREDMVEALADKADLRMLARKVSHDQFEMACDDLSRGLEHALGKLNVQEALWQQALDDIQREIETKLDKLELSPVKEFFNNKLKQLQENLKQMAALRREAEAAGTKKRLLTNVNCISCDAKAVMSMDPSAPAATNKGLPPSMSMKPYLSYELDAIRKTQASGLPQRNMHDWERIDKQASAPKPPQKVRSETDKHLCNRYCGGSHTTTTPAQRVARLGHFIKQWGPEVLPLSSGLATGDDGRQYKVSQVEAANVGPGGAIDVPCTPRSIKKNELKPASQRPTSVSPECRCLEEKLSKK